MRVLQVHWTFPPTTGGVESHVADLSEHLAARGCDVTVLTGEPRPAPCAGVTVRTTDVLRLDGIRAGLQPRRGEALAALDAVVTAVRPEVVHGHNLHHFAAAPALALDALARHYGFAIHHTFHETWPDVLHDRPVYRTWARNYAVSRHVGDECARRIGCAPVVRHLGVDTDRFRARRDALSGSGTPTVLHPARLLPWKGVHVSVDALALLAQGGVDARLVITDTAQIADWDGELGEYRARILATIAAHGLGNRVELRPARYQDMPALYEDADVVIYPTVAAEPYGLVPLEAMSARRPVVAGRCGGIPETVLDGVTGWLVTPGDAAALADRLAALLADPATAQRMGEAGRRRVLERFALDGYVDGMLQAYRVASMAK